MKKYAVLFILIAVLAGGSCATKPKKGNPQFTYQHYKNAVLLEPDKPATSPKIDIAVSLMEMEYPAEHAEYVHQVLYGERTLDEYRLDVFAQQKEKYRNAVFSETLVYGKDSVAYNWYYSESTDVHSFLTRGISMQRADSVKKVQTSHSGIVLLRDIQTSNGGSVQKYRQFINVDLDAFKVIKLTDFFVDFQEETRLRDLIYDELRKHSGLRRDQPLSEGIYFSNNPELTFNFFITDDGLGLHWDPEQIAPFPNGDIEVVLPWQVIRPLMLYTGIELLTKFNIYLFV